MKLIQKIKNRFIKEKPSDYELFQQKEKAQLESVLEVLYSEMHKHDDYDSQDSFTIQDFLERKVEWYINKNLPKYFNEQWWMNRKLDDLLKEKLDENLKQNLDKYFTKEIEEHIAKEISEISTYNITWTEAFEKFMKDYLEKNKWDLHYKIRQICDNEKFRDELSGRVWEEIWDMIQEKVWTCGC